MKSVFRCLCKFWWIELPALVAVAGLTYGGVKLCELLFASDDPGLVDKPKPREQSAEVAVKQSEFQHGHNRFSDNRLLIDEICHGTNIQCKPIDRGDSEKDLSRLATTYYHREGPVGRVLEKLNWFPVETSWKAPLYSADLRLPASLIGSVAFDFVAGNPLPMATFSAAWSEPPIAVLALGAGTVASYGRPFQHVHFFEPDDRIVKLSLPAPTHKLAGGVWQNEKNLPGELCRPFNNAYRKIAGKERPKFTYLEDAIERGCCIQVFADKFRNRAAMPYRNHYLLADERCGVPDNFYHVLIVEVVGRSTDPDLLLTQEAFKLYFEKLVPQGVVCVHTSHRFLDLPQVVAALAQSQTWTDDSGQKHVYVSRRSHDMMSDHTHWTSEWVMVARRMECLPE